MAADGLTDGEIARGKGMVKGSLVLGLEDTGSRMTRLGKGELLYGELISVDELLARVDAVTPDESRTVAAEVLGRPMSLAVVGPFAATTSLGAASALERPGRVALAVGRRDRRTGPSDGLGCARD